MKNNISLSKIELLVKQAKSLQMSLTEDFGNSRLERAEQSPKASMLNSQCSSN
jgi:hypothetical protein